MTAVFDAWSYCRFIEIQSNLTRNKFHSAIKAPIFLEAVLAMEIMQEPQSNLEGKVNPNILKDEFLSTPDPSIFTSIVAVLFEWSSKTS